MSELSVSSTASRSTTASAPVFFALSCGVGAYLCLLE